MTIQTRRIRLQMTLVLVLALASTVGVLLWKLDAVTSGLFNDPRPLILNGAILVLFLLGIVQLYRGLGYYERQERQITEFTRRRAAGEASTQVLAGFDDPSLLRERHDTIKELFAGGGPVDHGAISAIMLAGESQRLSFPRFVNNVLILTGVFGTVSSLIFALVGATDVLQAAVPGSGMGLLLLGMNTALTTTATAIVCYFFFTYFFARFTDLQTWIVGRLERAALLYLVPDFAYEADTVNRQAKLLVEDVRDLVTEIRGGLAGIQAAVAGLDESARARQQQEQERLVRQDIQAEKLDQALAQLTELRRVLVEGFRLDR
ncbi:hypothetical protein KJ682_03350 [bacterium]|nr:hypothetical protein [bacterium]